MLNFRLARFGAIVVLMSSGTLAQPAAASRTFQFAEAPSEASVRELATSIRVVATRDVTADFAKKEIQVSGSEPEVAVAGWLVAQLASPNPPARGAATAEYTVPESRTGAVRIFYLKHTPAQPGLNELVTTLRTVCDIQQIFTYNASHAIILRTSEERARLAAWLVEQLDVDADSHARGGRYDREFPGLPGGEKELVDVVFLTHPADQKSVNELVTTLRTIGDVQRIFIRSTPPGIAFRGSEAQVQLAEWLLKQLDAEPSAEAREQRREYVIAGVERPVTRVYYVQGDDPLPHVATAVRQEAGDVKLFIRTEPRMLAIRGTEGEVAVAEKVIREREQR